MSDEHEHEDATAREQAWLEGNRAAWVSLLALALRELGYSDQPEADKSRWILEREAAVSQLRSLCDDFGDNDWEPTLHLADVIDKHLGVHLHANCEDNA
jgi:hypothetical protein